VTKRLRQHWPMFGLAGNPALDALMAETADNLRFHHARSNQPKLRTYASFLYQSGSWDRARKVLARLECSLRPGGRAAERASPPACARRLTSLMRHLAQGHRAASLRGRLLPARADEEPDQAAQGAACLGPHVVSADRQRHFYLLQY
jgi:hypothetical protein